MSYSRWLDSNWYVFPSTAGCIEAWRAGDAMLQWFPEVQSLDDFLSLARASIRQDEFFETDILDLKRILEDNMDDIKKYCPVLKKDSGL